MQQRLKDLGSTLPIVFLSGHADLQTTVQTIKAGADDVLSKPVDSERLLKAIEDAITRHEGLRKQQSTLDADASHAVGLLRARGEWPRHRCATETRKELASFHVRSQAQETALYRFKRAL